MVEAIHLGTTRRAAGGTFPPTARRTVTSRRLSNTVWIHFFQNRPRAALPCIPQQRPKAGRGPAARLPADSLTYRKLRRNARSANESPRPYFFFLRRKKPYPAESACSSLKISRGEASAGLSLQGHLKAFRPGAETLRAPGRAGMRQNGARCVAALRAVRTRKNLSLVF